jgi:TetR/AcrR family transcriptional regulator, regulator of cefoperazone and chloramphenicol sensitivity
LCLSVTCFKHLFVASALPRDTKTRLVAAAAALFAERGFHGTKIRDIATRAGVNVAAGHYHFGSKRDLYLEVLRAEFAQIRSVLARRGAALPPEGLDGLARPALAELIRARAKVMLDLLIGPPPGLHGTLMQREMCDPSAALPVIVEEFVQPMVEEMEEIVAHLEPGLGRTALRRTVFSIMAQAIFYRFTMPATLHMMRARAYPKGLAAELAAHIAEFSLGGIERVAAAGGRGRRAD